MQAKNEKRYPYKFLDAYTKADTDFFFGRDEETESLYEMIFQTNILLVYGASGTGKTSLIQCGLAKRFESHNWFDLYIRRGSDINASLSKTLQEAAGDYQIENDLDWLDTTFEEEAMPNQKITPLQQQFKAIYLRYFRPIYLIFDQFEELFILGDQAEQEQFIQTVQEILTVKQPVKLIFVTREEYLGYLYDFEKAVPQLMRKKLRVEPMNLDKVKQVIVGTTETPNSIVSIEQEEEFTEAVFERLKGKNEKGEVKNRLTIDLPYLQVFLDRLYLEVTQDEARKTEAVFSLKSLDKVGDIEDVLRDFLEDQVRAIHQDLSPQYAKLTEGEIWQFLSPFATLEGTKEPLSKEKLTSHLKNRASYKAINDLLVAFINSRILRFNETEELYEIAHDTLAAEIATKRTDAEVSQLEVRRLLSSQMMVKEEAREIFTQKQLYFIEPFLDKISLTKEEIELIEKSRIAISKTHQQRKKRFQVTVAAVILAFIIMLALTIWALNQQANAKAEAKKAETTLKALQKNQAVAKARELASFGDSYQDFGEKEFACESYTAALDTLRNYPDTDLYQTIQQKSATACD